MTVTANLVLYALQYVNLSTLIGKTILGHLIGKGSLE